MKGRNAQVTGVDYRIAGGAIVAGGREGEGWNGYAMCGRLKIKVEGLSEWRGAKERVRSDGGGHTGGRKNRRGIARKETGGIRKYRGVMEMEARQSCVAWRGRLRKRRKHEKVAVPSRLPCALCRTSRMGLQGWRICWNADVLKLASSLCLSAGLERGWRSWGGVRGRG